MTKYVLQLLVQMKGNGGPMRKTGEEELVTEQETKQNNRTDVNPDERTAEIEEASVGLDTGVLAQKTTKLSKWQIDGMQDYKRVGLTRRETSKQRRLRLVQSIRTSRPHRTQSSRKIAGSLQPGLTSAVPLDNPSPKNDGPIRKKKGKKRN